MFAEVSINRIRDMLGLDHYLERSARVGGYATNAPTASLWIQAGQRAGP
ncbi:MAG: hypothetical protein MUQ10_16335 [Anaerolineae bacterium]|nr:hypothetical protein [Anaerolineae bacterium]